jgi:thioredoxin:protein disulfide reductase
MSLMIATSKYCQDICLRTIFTLTAMLTLCSPVLASDNAALGQLSNLLGNQNDDILTVDQAFPFTAKLTTPNTLQLYWNIAEEHYLYREKFQIGLTQNDQEVAYSHSFPAGKFKQDPLLGHTEVYTTPLRLTLQFPSVNPDLPLILTVKYQGCSERYGICYPPMSKTQTLSIPDNVLIATATITSTTSDITQASLVVSEQDRLAGYLTSGNYPLMILVFFGFGLLLSLTPCVFPMIPILSGIIAGQREITTRKAFMLSLTFVLAMALTYTFAGVLAGLFGQNLQAVFQNPWIISVFSLIFVILSLSMFGFYQLQLPTSLQGKLAAISHQQEGGTLVGAAIMGALSALIVGPCVAPPLTAALIVIGQTGDALLGGLALFSLSLGMGIPLLVIGTSAGNLLPKAGSWMVTVKAIFGVALLAVAIWMLGRILPPSLTMFLWGTLFIVSAAYMGAMEPLPADSAGWHTLWKGLGLVLLVAGILLLIGVASGNKHLLQPLYQPAVTVESSNNQALPFKRIKSLADIEQHLRIAQQNQQTVLLDFYADWCISCHEMEAFTFGDPQVKIALKDMLLLQADVTQNDKVDRALMKHFSVMGPPSLLFFDTQGQEHNAYRIVGHVAAKPFSDHIKRFQQSLLPTP